MAFNGSGVFVVNSTGNPVITGTTITTTWANALTADLAVGLTTCITKDGQSTPTANIPMGGYKLTGLAQGTTSGDAVAFPAPAQSVIGTTTNNDAAAGYIGEYISSTVLAGSAVSLTTATETNITSISLTAGDWDVEGVVAIAPAGGTTLTRIVGWVSSTSATIPTIPGGGIFQLITAFTASTQAQPVSRVRFSLAATTTIYLSAFAQFTVSTCTAYGTINARRVR